MAKKIFISYARGDGAAFVQKLAADLKSRGFDVWIDLEDIRAGKEWDTEIERALSGCDCLLFVETERSVTSRNVLDEVYYALEQNKKVIPLILVDSKTPFRLQRLQHVDFSKNYTTGLTHLLNELQGNHQVITNLSGETTFAVQNEKAFFTKNKRLLLLIVLLLIIIAAIFLCTKNADRLATNADDGRQQNINRLNEEVVGEWALVNVEPKAPIQNGYLKIVRAEDNKVRIKSYLQFYYTKTNDTLFLLVFNGFAGCEMCLPERIIKLEVEDIAIGSRSIKISRVEQNDTKVGDTIMNASANKSISAKVMLHFTGNNYAEIKVEKFEPSTLSHGLIIDPFAYTFRFKKTEY